MENSIALKISGATFGCSI